MKISAEDAAGNNSNSDTPEDSDNGNGPNGSGANAVITNDQNSYEDIFRPRRRELNRTPTR